MAKPILTKSTLKVILDSNSKLIDFMIQNNLDFMPCSDGITFCIAEDGLKHEECTPAVTIRLTVDNSYRLNRLGIESFKVDPEEFFRNPDCRAATALVAKSIMALYLAACTDIWTSPYVKNWSPQANISSADTMLSTLRKAISCGEISKESINRAFFFKMNKLPSQIVDNFGWNVSAGFERLADLSFVWLRNRWTTRANCIEFHEAAPCGKGIYDSAFSEPSTEPLNYVIHKSSDLVAIAAMHDKIYSEIFGSFNNVDVFDTICKEKTK